MEAFRKIIILRKEALDLICELLAEGAPPNHPAIILLAPYILRIDIFVVQFLREMKMLP